jgi:hypothetical protein
VAGWLGKSVEQESGDQPEKRPVCGHEGRSLEEAELSRRAVLWFWYKRYGCETRYRQQDSDKDRHCLKPAHPFSFCQPYREGQARGKQDPDQRGALAEGGVARALRVVAGQFSAPGGVGQGRPREANRDKRGPKGETAKARLDGGPEEHERRPCRKRQRGEEEAASATTAPAPSVRKPGEHGIGGCVEETDGEENRADGRYRQSDRFRIERRYDDVERQGQCHQRQGGMGMAI